MFATRARLTPLVAYERSVRQKAKVAALFAIRIERLHAALRREGVAAVAAKSAGRNNLWLEAAAAFAAAEPGRETIARAYRDMALRFGTRQVEPGAPGFGLGLRRFFHNYAANFPLPEEQESRSGFRALWTAEVPPSGYQEIAFSTICPLTDQYLMGVNFTVQPQSGSAHFIYGFVNPPARGLGGFSSVLIDLIRREARARMTAHLAAHAEDRPGFDWDGRPLILFEKNKVGSMTLPDILRDSAGIAIGNPPMARRRLASGGISQNLRDCIWDRRGGRIVGYHYLQSSLDGATIVPEPEAGGVIAMLAGRACDAASERALDRALADKVEGCKTLDLCAFPAAGTEAVPAAQIREHNRIFQGISVIKDPARIETDIYFRAQCASLGAAAPEGSVPLHRIAPYGNAENFDTAESDLKALLARLTWAELRKGKTRTYAEWRAAKMEAPLPAGGAIVA